jgi:predicted small secreted protein
MHHVIVKRFAMLLTILLIAAVVIFALIVAP